MAAIQAILLIPLLLSNNLPERPIGWIVFIMNRRILLFLCWMIATTVPVLAQETLYPVRSNAEPGAVFTADHSSFVIEKAFQYKLTVGYPSNDDTWFLPNSRTRIVALWVRIESLSERPLELNTAKFTCTGEDGQMYSLLSTDEAFNRIMTSAEDKTIILTNTLHGISLGKAGTKPTEGQLKLDTIRYSLQSGQIPAHDIREGLVYFEGPPQKKYVISVRLGDLWSRPFSFTNVKPK
jgi:hypothetical protein